MLYSDDYSNYCFKRFGQDVEKYSEHCEESRALCIAGRKKNQGVIVANSTAIPSNLRQNYK